MYLAVKQSMYSVSLLLERLCVTMEQVRGGKSGGKEFKESCAGRAGDRGWASPHVCSGAKEEEERLNSRSSGLITTLRLACATPPRNPSYPAGGGECGICQFWATTAGNTLLQNNSLLGSEAHL